MIKSERTNLLIFMMALIAFSVFATTLFADELEVNTQLDNAWQEIGEKMPDWMDKEGVEQLSYAMGILMQSTVPEINLSMKHLALGLESQRRVNRKIGSSYITIEQARTVVGEYEKHLNASAKQFMQDWRTKHNLSDEAYFRKVIDIPCKFDNEQTKNSLGKRYQYLLSDSWQNIYPENYSDGDKDEILKNLTALFCDGQSIAAGYIKAKEFRSSGEVIDGLQSLVKSETNGLFAKLKAWANYDAVKKPLWEEGAVYDFAIPAANAYGKDGMEGIVSPHAVLRILVRPDVTPQ